MSVVKGSRILIFGGSSGIGFGVAKRGVEEKAHVIISSSNSDRITKSVDSIKEQYPDASIEGLPFDLNTPDLESNLEKLFEKIGSLDHIVFTATGPLPAKPLAEVSEDFILDTARFRLVAPLLVAKVGAKYLKNSYTSSIIFTTGTVAHKPILHWSVLGAYATALPGLVRHLALELKPIRVNCVAPGPVNTELWGPNRDELLKGAAEHVALGKVGSADEVSQAYIYLIKDTNATGSSIVTDSGSLLL